MQQCYMSCYHMFTGRDWHHVGPPIKIALAARAEVGLPTNSTRRKLHLLYVQAMAHVILCFNAGLATEMSTPPPGGGLIWDTK